jgi:hypothetical protein
MATTITGVKNLHKASPVRTDVPPCPRKAQPGHAFAVGSTTTTSSKPSRPLPNWSTSAELVYRRGTEPASEALMRWSQ